MADTKIYLPKQQVTRGVPGYKGKDVVVIDPKTSKQQTAAQDAAAGKAQAAENGKKAAAKKDAEA